MNVNENNLYIMIKCSNDGCKKETLEIKKSEYDEHGHICNMCNSPMMQKGEPFVKTSFFDD